MRLQEQLSCTPDTDGTHVIIFHAEAGVAKEVCYCQSGIRECVLCVTDDLLAAIEESAAP